MLDPQFGSKVAQALLFAAILAVDWYLIGWTVERFDRYHRNHPDHGHAGQALVELALTVPFILALVLGSAELWHYAADAQQTTDRARTIRDYAAMHGVANLQDYANQITPNTAFRLTWQPDQLNHGAPFTITYAAHWEPLWTRGIIAEQWVTAAVDGVAE